MRNLKNIRRRVINLAKFDLPLTATTWNTSSDSLICAFGPSETEAVIELRRLDGESKNADDLSLLSSWDAPSPHPDLAVDKIVSLHYFPDTSSCCLVLAGGDIVVVRESPLPGEDLIEIVGSVDAGISAAAWSPDEELLAITTRVDTLLYMTRDFDNVTNVTFTAEDVKASNHVSVGWGKSETQFKGKRAKALKDPTMPERVDEGVLSHQDQGNVTIKWRGDGAYVAVNTIEQKTRRMIRVYSREGVLDSVSEPVDYLEGPLSWRPAGNIIAGIQRLNNRIDVVFFERNGLRHGQFTLRMSAEEVQKLKGPIDLEWNSDSSVIAVSFEDKVQLWTMGNYHYYLKQEIRTLTKSSTATPARALWHSEKPLHLAVQASESVQVLQYAFTVARGPLLPPYDFGSVAVIDGTSLKLTPLRLANVPPPMARHEVRLEESAVDVSINASGTLIAVLHDTALSVLRYDPSLKPLEDPTIQGIYPLPLCSECISRQICFRSENEIFILSAKKASGLDVIHQFNMEPLTFGDLRHDLEEIINIHPSVDYQSLCLQGGNGTCLELRNTQTISDTQEHLSGLNVTVNPTGPWVELAHIGKESIIFNLSSNGQLCANDRLLVRNCTSFLVTSAHLIFTTTQHLLKFVHLDTEHNLEIPPDEPETDERCRSIERGARLITATPTSYSVVLQMPRGNLETIYPRALVLTGIRKSINAKEYKTAFFACRNQRVDMNILHDHAPEQFMNNIPLFLDQIKKVEHVDLFLSQLREEDVSQSMYKETIKTNELKRAINGNNNISTTQNNSKVNRICDGFLNALQSKKARNPQNIITANVCKSPPALEAGLTVVAKLREAGDESVERAAEHICFLADVNQLYDHALGLYDLDLALLIAQQSQKDPREYLPYLQSLQEMTPLRRRFTIDDHLGRHSKALTHLKEADDFEELKAYTEKHELHSTALDLYKYEQDRFNAIMKLYADFLNPRNRFKEAGIAYEYLSDHTSASAAYFSANMWRESLSSATLIPLPEAELSSLALSLADDAAESKNYFDAATIHLDYLHNVSTAIHLFCKCFHYAEAMRICGLHRRPDLLSAIDTGLVEGSATMSELLADCKSQLAAQVPRLRELRLKKETDPLAFFGGEEGVMGDIPDNVSIAPSALSTSGGTFLTRYTGKTTGTLGTNVSRKTSKNRRREERKRARGKKGSVYEEEYLVNSVGRLIERVNEVSEEVQRLVEGLLRRGMRERAEKVERSMVEVVDACKGCVGEVFEVERTGKLEGKEGQDEDETPLGADGVLFDALEQAKKVKAAPVVKQFARLSLVG
ncbi:elongator complex protein 1 [Patellaria atrata CBS 101060]|uniref:Elongator complex protein 1 n=1 Tax=Patellaria atrata CBS 101060 TaxID=1346257 RepID=A0A9P4SDI2_9PEZI|nr:elongator complex protein 1 [Patellaria atrata CBS 101060]